IHFVCDKLLSSMDILLCLMSWLSDPLHYSKGAFCFLYRYRFFSSTCIASGFIENKRITSPAGDSSLSVAQ
ncbi:hypothetical protein, partial [uncultured Traorella sp.]|uniref:hypothetical protein n=1 Tax=uncultured Traorella sp. TaxID=1929048 RepID=UPI0025FE1B66